MTPEDKLRLQLRIMHKEIEELKDVSSHIIAMMRDTGIDGYFGIHNGLAELRVYKDVSDKVFGWAKSKGYDVDIFDNIITVIGDEFEFIVRRMG